MVVVLGIDPGTAHTGYGVVLAQRGSMGALDGGVIGTGSGEPLERRLTRIHARVCDLISEHRPDAVAIEELYFGQNARSAFAVGQARGVVLLGAGMAGIPCFSYTPQAVKSAVCGSGAADKAQVQRMVGTLLSLPEPPEPDHAADALAVAVCHANGAPLRAAVPVVIASVRGEVLSKGPDQVVVESAGVGYRLSVSAETMRGVPAVGRETTLLSHLVMRDDAIQLYGFASEGERDLFLMLVGVQGVGPKVALAVLSGGSASELTAAIAAGDARPLPGRAGHRQAHGRADHRRAAREGGRRGGRADRGAPRRGSRRPARARARGPDRPRLPARRGRGDARRRQRRHARGAAGRGAEGGSGVSGIRTPGVERLQDPEPKGGEEELDRSLRPRRLDDFVGQRAVKEQLQVFVEAARARDEALDHVLLAGPPGLGKTSLALIVAEELGAPIQLASGPAFERKGDVASQLTSLEPRSVFFVDEIHRLPRALEETFYPAMEDRQLPITVGQGAGARIVTLTLPPFTMIGATTRAGLLTTPLRDRFGVTLRLELYEPEELGRIVTRSAAILETEIDSAGAETIASRSRGTPRVANRLLKRVRDYAEVRGRGVIDAATAAEALELLEVDEAGLDRLDRDVLRALCEKFGGGPVGLSTLAISVGEEPDTIEDVLEPFLLRSGFIMRTPRGRVATDRAWAQLGLERPGGGLF